VRRVVATTSPADQTSNSPDPHVWRDTYPTSPLAATGTLGEPEGALNVLLPKALLPRTLLSSGGGSRACGHYHSTFGRQGQIDLAGARAVEAEGGSRYWVGRLVRREVCAYINIYKYIAHAHSR
jgi:hypothetical protein